MAALPIIAGAGQVLSGLLGGIFSSGDKQKALELAQEAYQELAKIGMPPDLAQGLILEQFKEAGVYTPELEQEINLGISQVEQIKEDASLRDAQSKALAGLEQVSKGGLRPEDRAAYNELRAQTAAAAQGKIGQIQQGFQARGQGGQGAEIAAQIAAAQEGANRLSAGGDQLSADASRRALEALMSSGTLSGQIRGQDFDIARTKASAADEIARFNAANAMGIQSRNIAAKNLAAQQALANKQRVMDTNTAMRNAELNRQNEARRQYWNDQMARQNAISNAKLGLSNVYAGQAANTAQGWQNIGSGFGGAVNSIYQGQQQNKLFDLLKQRNAAKVNPVGGSNIIDLPDDNPYKYFA